MAHDYLDLDSLLSAEERALRDRVRAFTDERVRPHIAAWYEAAHFSRELTKELGALGLLGMHLTGYGCAGRSAVEYGLAAMELEAGDSGLRTFFSVQGSLVMTAISRWGSEEQKQRWLPAFQLTQEKLVEMVLEIQKGLLVALHTGRLKDAGRLRPEQLSFGKLANVRTAIDSCRQARTILGGNGITLDHSALRHAINLEAVRTYERTDEIHTLIMGRAITGIPAFAPGQGLR